MKYTVNVTKQDIDFGRRGSPHGCPFILAAKRVIPKAWTVGLGQKWYCLNIGSDYSDPTFFSIDLPPDADKWVRELDRFGKRVKPASFEIEVPDVEGTVQYSGTNEF